MKPSGRRKLGTPGDWEDGRRMHWHGTIIQPSRYHEQPTGAVTGISEVTRRSVWWRQKPPTPGNAKSGVRSSPTNSSGMLWSASQRRQSKTSEPRVMGFGSNSKSDVSLDSLQFSSSYTPCYDAVVFAISRRAIARRSALAHRPERARFDRASETLRAET